MSDLAMSSTLEERLRQFSQAPPDEPRPALVIQGGGLRGIYSMGALTVLEDLDLRDAFSVVVGSSAGAINGAYFLGGQAREGLGIYLDELAGGKFVAPWRPWRVIDVDFLIDTVLRCQHPLDLGEMRSAHANLLTVLTDAETAGIRIASSEQMSPDIYEVFRATAALPLLYNKRVSVGDRQYVDGGISSLVPLQEAMRHSNGEAVVLLTRGAGHRLRRRGPIFRAALRLLSPGYSAPLRARICDLDKRHNGEMERLESGGHSGHRTWALWPSDLDRLVTRTTKSRARLSDCAKMGRNDMLALLKQSPGRDGLSLRKPEQEPDLALLPKV